MKETSQKRLLIICFHLYEMSGITGKYGDTKKINGCLGLRWCGVGRGAGNDS